MFYYLEQKLSQMPAPAAWLSPREREILARLKIPKRRNDWLLGRWTAKQVILHIAGTEIPAKKIAQLEIIAAAEGAPQVFFADQPLDMAISISHSHGTALSLAGPGKIALGCDLEKIEPRSTAFVRDYFTTQEMHLLQGAGEAERPFVANLIWSAKESALKALHTGLRLDTRQLQFSCVDFVAGQEGGEFQVHFAKENRWFYGCWKKKNTFVLTFVTTEQQWQLKAITG